MHKFLLGALIAWTAWAQTGVRTPEPNLPKDIAGSSPLEMPAPETQERPTGESISVSQMQHKIPKDEDRAYQHARKLSRAGEHAKAADELEKLIRRDSKLSRAYNQLGTEYALLGRFTEAEAAFRRSLELEPGSWRADYNLSLVLYATGDFSGAEQSTLRALRLGSQDPQVHLLLGYLLLRHEDTRAQGLKEVEFAARTITAAQSFLRTWEAR